MKQRIFLISDTHFNHKNIIKYCGRPFDTTEEMNEFLIAKWNSKVHEEDLVIHLGDFGKGSDLDISELRRKLNGNIILIKGNHDYKLTKYSGLIIIEGSLIIDNLILTHRPIPTDEIPEGFINIHGHIHDKESYSGINVSVEQIDYEPKEMGEVLKCKSG